jgi:hypothetical protein
VDLLRSVCGALDYSPSPMQRDELAAIDGPQETGTSEVF